MSSVFFLSLPSVVVSAATRIIIVVVVVVVVDVGIVVDYFPSFGVAAATAVTVADVEYTLLVDSSSTTFVLSFCY